MEVFHLGERRQPFPPHFHWHYTLGIVCHGIGRIMLHGRQEALREGTVLFLKPGEVHACTAPQAGFAYCGVNISPWLVRQ